MRLQPTTLEAVLADDYARLIRLAGVVCRDPADAQDAVQAAIVRALRHRNDLRDPARVTPWLNQIVIHEAIRIDGRRRRWWTDSPTDARRWRHLPDIGAAVCG